jgi:hypothetical protein
MPIPVPKINAAGASLISDHEITISKSPGTGQANSPTSEFCNFSIKRPKNRGTFMIAIAKYPTGNCQLMSVAYMNQLLHNVVDDDGNYSKEIALAILMECIRLISCAKMLSLLDVNEKYALKVEEMFEVNTKTPYTSSNGSKMVMFIVKMKY